VIRQGAAAAGRQPHPVRNLARIYASHPDHLATGEAALDAVYPDAATRSPTRNCSPEEGLAEWPCRKVWLTGGSSRPLRDITDTFPAKLAALRAHESQQAGVPDWTDACAAGWARNATAAGLPAGRLAERSRSCPQPDRNAPA